MAKKRTTVSRRRFLATSLSGAVAGATLSGDAFAAQADPGTRQATGVKVGEVTENSAIIWLRLTAKAAAYPGGVAYPPPNRENHEKIAALPEGTKIDDLRGAAPGAAGVVRLRYAPREDLVDAKVTAWGEVTEATDFTRQFALSGLSPGTVYYFAAESAPAADRPPHAPLRGRFATAPPADRHADVVFTAISCQGYRDLDHDDGYHIYPAMAALNPKFLVPTGDSVYLDNDDFLANTPALARHHWHRMHALPRHVAFHAHTPCYWEKDDHDTYSDDCWPTIKATKMLPLTFAEGQDIFRQQVPMGDKTYRTFRWGQNLQIWLTEGRDFRSRNRAPDGPEKTIWGQEQKDWLFKTLQASDARFKVLVNPTPIVGPDRQNKADNHSNAAFQHEGDEFRLWVKKNLGESFFVVCGDRHWQYHSVHPDTGLHEFGTGAASDPHAEGSPGEDPKYHRFHRMKGGFVSVSVAQSGDRPNIVFRHHDVLGKVVHESAHG